MKFFDSIVLAGMSANPQWRKVAFEQLDSRRLDASSRRQQFDGIEFQHYDEVKLFERKPSPGLHGGTSRNGQATATAGGLSTSINAGNGRVSGDQADGRVGTNRTVWSIERIMKFIDGCDRGRVCYRNPGAWLRRCWPGTVAWKATTNDNSTIGTAGSAAAGGSASTIEVNANSTGKAYRRQSAAPKRRDVNHLQQDRENPDASVPIDA
jgi:hypothetical protein